ncbi:MAG: PASTA domain-containing protein [Bacteroidota bacterium]
MDTQTNKKLLVFIKKLGNFIYSKPFLKNLGSFIYSKLFLKHFGFAILMVIVLLFGTFFSLNLITHHGEGLSVPDFTGLDIKQVAKEADKKNLKFKIIDSVFNAPGKKGTVIAQTPPANFKVKEGRTILLTVKTFNPQRIPMPDFTGVSLIQAKADIETYGLKIGKLKYIPDIATNNVLEQMFRGKPITPGTFIEKNSIIDLVLGLGKSNKITIVPDLKGLTFDVATQNTADHSLNIGILIYDQTVESSQDSTNAIIWKQSPEKNTQITIGSPIDIWLTLDMNKVDAGRDSEY